MGRIKTLLVKRIAKKLIRVHPDEFVPEFAKNKELVEQYTDVTSKKMRNVISGYTSRLIRQKAISDKGPRRRLHEEDLSKFYQ